MQLRYTVIITLAILGIGGTWQFWEKEALSQIPIEPQMIYNLSAHDEPYALFDEQFLGKKEHIHRLRSHPRSSWSPGFEKKEMYLPIEIILDLEQVFQLHSLSIFDSTGSGLVTIEYGNPGNWLLLCKDSLTQYGVWSSKTFDKNPETRFLRFLFFTSGAEIGEVLMFGKQKKALSQKRVISNSVESPKLEAIAFDAYCGVNGFINDPFERLAPVAGILREYHRWDWDEGNEDTTYKGFPDNAYAFAPSWARGEHWSWDFDQFYTKAKQNGLQVSPSLGGCAPYLRDFDPKRNEDKPILPQTNPQDPASYAALADYAFQFAARYGAARVADSALKLAPDQKRVSGLGLIDFIEDGNEPDRWWQGPAAYHAPVQYAARLSAFYDGHGGVLGKNAGVKHADSALPVVMGGLARPDTNYLRAMLFWAIYNRPQGDFPADVINLHHYCNTGGDQWAGDTRSGLSPEADGLYERLSGLVAFRNKHLAGRELWLSEFGYDTNPISPQHAPATADASAAEMQARWLTRSLLIAQAAGVDRSFVYMLRDVSAESTVRYNSSGLTRELWHAHEPKISWFYIAALRNALTGYYFKTRLSLPEPGIHAYTYVHGDTQDSLVVIWNSREKNRLVSLNAFGISSPSWTLQLTPNSRAGALQKPQGDMIDISGKPLIIGFGKQPERKGKITPLGTRSVKSLFDEQALAGDPAIGKGGTPTQGWKVPWGAGKVVSTFDIGDQVQLSDIWLFDGEGSDSLIIEIADRTTGIFRRIGGMKLDQYNIWRRLDGTGWKGNIIRFTLGGGEIKEVVLYGE